jgi:hypothetical protein
LERVEHDQRLEAASAAAEYDTELFIERNLFTFVLASHASLTAHLAWPIIDGAAATGAALTRT